jgi:hypothetical protein
VSLYFAGSKAGGVFVIRLPVRTLVDQCYRRDAKTQR